MAKAPSTSRCAVVIPNWDGEQHLSACLLSLRKQTIPAHIIVVDNGSVDGSVELMKREFPEVEILALPKNRGFAGGVNVGITAALAAGYEYIALLNNDAVADKNWLKALFSEIETRPEVGIVTGKITDFSGKYLDSTGEFYTTWGLSFSRGRDEKVGATYDKKPIVFGASGGASLYRSAMLQQIGPFDEDFFAYYEDVDISFRARLAGWHIRYVPGAVVRHHIGVTSGRIKGFTTYQTLKNLPLLCIKNVPLGLLFKIAPRLWLAHTSFFWSAVARGQGGVALKGLLAGWLYVPKKLAERYHIQSKRTISTTELRALLIDDLPPDATRLRRLIHPLTLPSNKKES